MRNLIAKKAAEADKEMIQLFRPFSFVFAPEKGKGSAVPCANRYQREYLDIIEALNGDEAGRRSAWEREKAGNSFFQGKPAPLSFLPNVYSPQERRLLKHAAETMYGILRKVAKRYRDDASFRALFRFDPRVEELALLPDAVDEPLPLGRVDVFFNRKSQTFRFCEFNTDASSGMNENCEALACVRTSESYRRFAARHKVFDDVHLHFDGWVSRFMRLYAQWLENGAAKATDAASMENLALAGKAATAQGDVGAVFAGEGLPVQSDSALGCANNAEKEGLPRVAIVVCFDSPNPHMGEQEFYRQAFERAGVACSVFDVRQLDFDGVHLRGHKALAGESEVRIDCIWRFCLMVDLLEYWNQVQPFIEAVRSGAVPMFGGFSTQVLHDKQLFAVLHRPEAQAILSDEERRFVCEHIPATMFLDDPSLDLEDVKAHPERWVIKPCDWYESIDVTVGAECDCALWEQLVDEHAHHETGSYFLLQECCETPLEPAIALYGNEEDFTASVCQWGAVTGLYLFCGEFAGIYVRQGPYRVIGSARKGLVTPVLWVED